MYMNAVAVTTTTGSSIPSWLGAVGALIVIAAALGAAVAVYRANLATTQVKIARDELASADAITARLRGEISDYSRREAELEGDVRVLQSERDAANERLHVLEDLVTKRQDDQEIRAEIAAVRKVVDENVLSQLTAISENQLQFIRILKGSKDA